jgi:hypothetical protein
MMVLAICTKHSFLFYVNIPSNTVTTILEFVDATRLPASASGCADICGSNIRYAVAAVPMQVGMNFELAPWKNTGGCILKGGSVDEAQLQLDDHAIKSQAMMSSPFAKPFHDRISMWSARLARMQAIFDEWLTCQVKWMYLGPVYGSEEIAKQARYLPLPACKLPLRMHDARFGGCITSDTEFMAQT